MTTRPNDQALLEQMYRAAVEHALPRRSLAHYLPQRPKGRTIVVGAGKAAATMAQAFEEVWDGPLEGLVVTSYANAVSCKTIEVLEASHPVPDNAGVLAAAQMFAAVQDLSADDLVVALISGGGSSLLASPAEGLTLSDEQAINRSLLASGAPIGVMNVVRSQFSSIKAGRLAAACHPAPVATLIISDVPGDNPSIVSSGPTVPSRSSREMARLYANLYKLDLPLAAQHLLLGDSNLVPDPDDPVFASNTTKIIASAAQSLEAAAQVAKEQGETAAILSDSIEGEARDVALVMAGIAREVSLRDRPFPKPVVLLSGGETTVTLRGRGRGGRNSEFLLAFALAIEGIEGITALAADTDGIDGSGNNAGAFADGGSAKRMRQAGIDPLSALDENDTYRAFAAIGDLFKTGPTGTNVNDFRAILVR